VSNQFRKWCPIKTGLPVQSAPDFALIIRKRLPCGKSVRRPIRCPNVSDPTVRISRYRHVIIKSFTPPNKTSNDRERLKTDTEDLSLSSNDLDKKVITNKNNLLLSFIYPDKINKNSLPVLSITIRTIILLSIVAIVVIFQNEIIFRYNLARAEIVRAACFIDMFIPEVREQFDLVYDIGFKFIPILLIVVSVMISCILTGFIKLFCTGQTYMQIMKIFSFALVILGAFTFYKLDLLFNLFNELLKRNNF
jgi:hypothetical protein